jgi:hypothetical protein
MKVWSGVSYQVCYVYDMCSRVFKFSFNICNKAAEAGAELCHATREKSLNLARGQEC